jgi:Lon protease-like protein
MVVLKEGGSKPGQPAIYPAGTAGLMVDVEPLPDGRSNIVLEGRFRFLVDREVLTPSPYRQANVRRVEEAAFDLSDPGVVTLHRELAETTRALALEIGERFPIDADEQLPDTAADLAVLVNRLCAGLDLPVMHKLQLLSEPLPRRALDVLSVLRGRRRTLDLLRPYRHLAVGASLN